MAVVEPERAEALATTLAALTEVWLRNPNKSLMQIVSRASRDIDVFDIFDATDEQLAAGLKSIGAR